MESPPAGLSSSYGDERPGGATVRAAAVDDYAAIRTVVGYLARHAKHRPDGDVTETPWRYSPLNWGHAQERMGFDRLSPGTPFAASVRMGPWHGRTGWRRRET